MRANDQAQPELVDQEVLSRLGEGGVHLAMSALSPAAAGAAVEPHAACGVHYLACPIYQNYGRAIVEQRFSPPGFALSMGAKDVRLARDAARAAQVPMPFAGLLEDRFLRCLANGRAELDWTGIAADVRDSVALPVRDAEGG